MINQTMFNNQRLDFFLEFSCMVNSYNLILLRRRCFKSMVIKQPLKSASYRANLGLIMHNVFFFGG